MKKNTVSIWRTLHRTGRIVASAAVVLLLAGCTIPLLPWRRKQEEAPPRERTYDISTYLRQDHWRPAWLRLAWNTRLPSEPSLAVTADKHLIVVDKMNWVFAIEKSTGIVKWKREIYAPRIDDIVTGHSEILVVSRDVIHRMREKDGKTLWIKTIPVAPSASITRSAFRISVGTWGSRVYGLNIKTVVPDWISYIGDTPLGRMEDSGVRVYGVTRNGKVFSLNGATGKEEWHLNLHARTELGMVSDTRRIYVPSREGVLYTCSKTGEGMLWTFPVSYPISSVPVVSHGRLFLSTSKAFYCLETHRGRMMWKKDEPLRILMAGKKYVYALRGKDTIVTMNRETGKIKGTARIDGFTMFPHNPTGKRIFCISPAADVLALEEFIP